MHFGYIHLLYFVMCNLLGRWANLQHKGGTGLPICIVGGSCLLGQIYAPVEPTWFKNSASKLCHTIEQVELWISNYKSLYSLGTKSNCNGKTDRK